MLEKVITGLNLIAILIVLVLVIIATGVLATIWLPFLLLELLLDYYESRKRLR
jgi:predicted membrane protein